MYLHDICRASVLVFAMAVLSLLPGPADADETTIGITVSVSLSSTGAGGPQMSIWQKSGTNTASFCGACSNSDHDSCGGQSNGWSCCSSGCTNSKMQCWNVTSCDKIAGLEFDPRQQPRPGLATAPHPPKTILAQNDYCSNWYNNIQAELDSYRYQCSGDLSQSQYDYCVSWQSQINNEVSSYNSQCN